MKDLAKSGWVDCTLGDVLSLVRNGLNCKQNKDGVGAAISRIETIATGEFNLEKVGYSEISEQDREKFSLRRGDILFSHINSPPHIGKSAVLREDVDLTHGVNLLLFRPFKNVDPSFLQLFLNTLFLSGYWRGMCKQSVNQASVNQKDIRKVPFSYPPLEEQQRIVAVLDEAFKGLARARAHAEANLQNARELFESHLVDLFTHPDSSWQQAQLNDYCEKITVGHVGPMAKRYVMTGTPFLRSQNVRPFKIDLTDVKYIDEEFTKELGKSELRPGDVAIVRTGYPGTCAVIPEHLELANCADLVIARTGPKLNPHFLALLLNSTYGKNLVAGASVGAAQKHFNVGAAKKAVFPFPPLLEQERLVDQADEISTACNSLSAIAEEKLQDLDDLRQSLLQKAFAGELT